jgi:hypothetical protein
MYGDGVGGYAATSCMLLMQSTADDKATSNGKAGMCEALHVTPCMLQLCQCNKQHSLQLV